MSAATAQGSTSRLRAAPEQSPGAQPQERDLDQTENTIAPGRARTGTSDAEDDFEPASPDASDFDASVSEDERRRMVAEAAYYIAQRRGFDNGLELEDWLAAEAEVNARLASL
jgi:hypothetical protein